MEKTFSNNPIFDFTGQNLAELAEFGKIYLFDTASSTQEIAKGLIKKKEPAVVIALTQSRGRGRFRRDWHSEPGGIYFSYLLFPYFPVKAKTAQMTLVLALALAQSLESLTGKKVEIRWPNDLILAGKKVGGILCETNESGLIIGVGLNLNQTFLPATLPDATSLFIETNQEFEIGKILKTLLTALTDSFNNFALSKFADYLPELKKRQTLINQRVKVELWLRRIEGNVIDLTDDGRLVIRTDSGRLLIITAGKVHRILNA